MNKESLKIFDKLSEQVIAYRPVYARICGGVTGGILLSQLVYWGKVSEWREFFKTDIELRNEIGLSRHEMITAKKKIQDLGFAETDTRGYPPRTFYSLNLDKIIEAISICPASEKPIVRKADKHSPKSGQTVSEKQTNIVRNPDNIHTEITTKNKTYSSGNEIPDVDRLPDKKKPKHNLKYSEGDIETADFILGKIQKYTTWFQGAQSRIMGK
ncbi:MAG: hypothetical protein ACQ9MH_13150 [Nitrospinales bacterium]